MPDGFQTFDPASGLPPMRSRRCTALVKYWDTLRGDRLFPSREEVDPGAIKSLLPHIMLTGIEHNPFRVFYRLVGTEIVRFAKFDFTGCYADSLHFQDTEGADWAEYYRAVIEARRPGIGVSHWTVAGNLQRWIEFVICPLSTDGMLIDRCIAAEDYEHLNMVEIDTLPPVEPQQGDFHLARPLGRAQNLAMHLEIFSDTICPWCYIGKRRLERALKARPMPDLSIRWRAFQLNPGMPNGGMDRQQYLAAKFGSAERAGRLYDTVTRVGAEEGIRFRFDRISRTPNTMRSHRLLALAGQHGMQSKLLDRLFAAYFTEARDTGSAEVLLDIGLAADLPRPEIEAALAEDSPIGTTLAEDFLARRQGMNGVPYFVFNGRFGLSGAQEPEALYHMFDLAREDDALVRV